VEVYPKFFRAIKDAATQEALTLPMPRIMARRAGLRAGPQVAACPITLIDTTLSASFEPLRWQWTIDLSLYSRLRMDARSADVLYLYYSVLGGTSSAYDPGEWQTLSDSTDADGQVGFSLFWFTPVSEARAPVRLCFAGVDGPGVALETGGPTGVWLQAE
jgi:hypothetical protein